MPLDAVTNQNQITAINATIADSATVSDVVKIYGNTLCGLILPATVEGTTIGFQVCDTEDGTFVTLKDINNTAIEVTVTATTAAAYPLNPQDFAAWPYVKLVVASQTGESVIKCLVKAI